MKKIIILHVFDDEKFFDPVSDFFDQLNNTENLYFYYTPNTNLQFRYIKKIEKIKIFYDYCEYIRCFSRPDIDIIYFQSLSFNKYKLFRYIDDKKKVIWWCFGCEIYYSVAALKPLIPIELYKPLTKSYQKSHQTVSAIYWVKFICKKMLSLYYYFLRKKVISRVDYFSPVLPIEYYLMKQSVSYFKARPFMLLAGPSLNENHPFNYFSFPQNILVGNSLTYTNNHLDIFQIIRHFRLKDQKFIFPINYGKDYDGDRKQFKQLAEMPLDSSLWIEDFMSYEAYSSLVDTASHAIFGHMRQQSMGNIFMCMRKGIKVFLYKDSIIYKQLKQLGYIVFTIEENLSERALKEVLTKEDAYTNYRLFMSRQKNKLQDTEKELNRILNS